MKTLSIRKEEISFSVKLDDAGSNNTSEKLCTIEYDVHTVELNQFKGVDYVSPEYMPVTRDVVMVDGRMFEVSKATRNFKDYWLSVTLPVGMDPRPKPREWSVKVSPCVTTGNEYIWDARCCSTYGPKELIKVREVLD